MSQSSGIDCKKNGAATPKKGHIHILIADDHAPMREVLVNLLQSQTDFDIVAQASNGREAVQLAKLLKPHVILMDVSMPEMNGIDATVRIRKMLPDTRIFGMSAASDAMTETIMREAGALTLLNKSEISISISDLIRTVHKKNGITPATRKRT
jgi:NarL family two-component system response regulator LiaR